MTKGEHGGTSWVTRTATLFSQSPRIPCFPEVRQGRAYPAAQTLHSTYIDVVSIGLKMLGHSYSIHTLIAQNGEEAKRLFFELIPDGS